MADFKWLLEVRAASNFTISPAGSAESKALSMRPIIGPIVASDSVLGEMLPPVEYRVSPPQKMTFYSTATIDDFVLSGGLASTTFHGCSTSQDSPRCSTTVRWTLVEQPWNSRGTGLTLGLNPRPVPRLFHTLIW